MLSGSFLFFFPFQVNIHILSIGVGKENHDRYLSEIRGIVLCYYKLEGSIVLPYSILYYGLARTRLILLLINKRHATHGNERNTKCFFYNQILTWNCKKMTKSSEDNFYIDTRTQRVIYVIDQAISFKMAGY